ncbi:hypothetical protein GCM10010389_62700 [Streptomyces echinoruber]|uniref:Uncharacterized protein n=1 Tax=Streptomyces echinoruber TaxID=68898 RepID=A0A918RWR6_9ACTN|nr:hypothetical protein GCM10010389_62700 [Streptomyces echinoruber]
MRDGRRDGVPGGREAAERGGPARPDTGPPGHRPARTPGCPGVGAARERGSRQPGRRCRGPAVPPRAAAQQMGAGRRVARAAACRQAGGDAVLDRGGFLTGVLELRPDAGHFQPQPADARQHAAVRCPAGGGRGVTALRLEPGQLPVEQGGLLRRVVHDTCGAAELDGRVEAGRYAVFGRDVRGGLPGAGDVDVVVDHAQQHLGSRLQRGPQRVGAGEVGDGLAALGVVGEVQRLHERRFAGRAVDGELAEGAPGQPVLPLGVVAGGVPGVDQHHNSAR